MERCASRIEESHEEHVACAQADEAAESEMAEARHEFSKSPLLVIPWAEEKRVLEDLRKGRFKVEGNVVGEGEGIVFG